MFSKEIISLLKQFEFEKVTLGILIIFGLCLLGSCKEEPNLLQDKAPSKDVTTTDMSELFTFLPPIGKEVPYNGIFDCDLSPVVQICDNPNCNEPFHAEFSMNSAGTSKVRVTGDYYYVNWNTKETNAKIGCTYYIKIKVNGKVLGSAKVLIIEEGKQPDSVPPGTITFVSGKLLPIKFRIEKADANGISLMVNPDDPLLFR